MPSNETNFELMKLIASRLVNEVPMNSGNARVSVHLCWSGPHALNYHLTKADLQAYISQLVYAPLVNYPVGTPREIHHALRYALQYQLPNGDRPGVPNTVVFLTDAPSWNLADTQVGTHPNIHATLRSSHFSFILSLLLSALSSLRFDLNHILIFTRTVKFDKIATNIKFGRLPLINGLINISL